MGQFSALGIASMFIFKKFQRHFHPHGGETSMVFICFQKKMSLFKHNHHVIPGWDAGGLACSCSCFSASRAWGEIKLLHQSRFLRDFRAPTWRMGPFSGQSLCVTIGSDIGILATSCSMVIKPPQASGSSFSPSLHLRVKRKPQSEEVLQMYTLEILF